MYWDRCDECDRFLLWPCHLLWSYDCHDACSDLSDIHRHEYDLFCFLHRPNDELMALHYEVHEWHDDRYPWPPSASRWHILIENIPDILIYFLQLNPAFESWSSSSEWSEPSLPRRGGGAKALRILIEADLNRWIMKSCWSWRASKLIIQTWPWCWPHTCWYSRASRWSEQWASLTAAWYLIRCLDLLYTWTELEYLRQGVIFEKVEL